MKVPITNIVQAVVIFSKEYQAAKANDGMVDVTEAIQILADVMATLFQSQPTETV